MLPRYIPAPLSQEPRLDKKQKNPSAAWPCAEVGSAAALPREIPSHGELSRPGGC